ncbi:alpha/beta-hydrolase [Ramaria rubella]|nr:alpha/beta-hydrolase [Ramaria rubella]
MRLGGTKTSDSFSTYPSLSNPKPFLIDISVYEVSALRAKLSTVRFPNEFEDAGWQSRYGAPLADIHRLVSHWRDGYDWKKQEIQINALLPQFTIVHFAHKRSETENAIPLLFVHGCKYIILDAPGHSILIHLKFYLLITPSSKKSPCFHVITYSLPGYGFLKEVGHKLIQALGYKNMITRKSGQLYGGRNCKASHTNMMCYPLLYLKHLERAGFSRTDWFLNHGSGYIYEKPVNWSDNYPWMDDEGPAASIRIYYELSSRVPVGVSVFPKELLAVSPAHEKPGELVDDLRAMFGRGGPAFGVAPGTRVLLAPLPNYEWCRVS